jgi:outer membrane protein OmpA-like peptidoglycan-associated protein
MKKKYILTLIALIPLLATSQSGRLKYANKLYESMSYFYAAEAYEDCIARKTDSSTVAANIATSYDKVGNTQKAIEWYNFLNRNTVLSKEQHLRLGLLERQVGRYQESEMLMASYEQKYGIQDVSSEVLKSSQALEKLKQDNGNFELKHQGVNTKNSEIGAVYSTKDEIILASAKRRQMVSKRLHSWTGDSYYDLYRASIDENGEIGKMKMIKSDIATKFHDGPATFDSTSGYLYFTRNNFINGKKGLDDQNVIRLKIYRAKVDGEKFKDEEELISINSESFSTAHPSISKDGKCLYFASDRPGGLGGMDIYSVELENGLPKGEPVNMGDKVNTSQHEAFPYFHSEENLLFFSSEGHSGLGGLDIFVAKLSKEGTAKKTENLGAPINSLVDDFSFISNNNQTQGYFSSNREGGKGSDDVYGFKQKSPIKNGATVTGSSKDLLVGNNLEDVMIYLADKDGKILDSVKTSKDGGFEFDLGELNDDFKLMGSKGGYISTSKTVDFDPENYEYDQDVDLMPLLEYYFVGMIVDRTTNQALEEVNITLVDKKTGKEFVKQSTEQGGTYKTTNLPYGYQENINYEFKFDKPGYITKTVDVSEVLARKAEIRVDGQLSKIGMDTNEPGTNIGTDINPIYFDLNSSIIRPDAALELDKIVKIMKDNPGISIELGSHTDTRASDYYNMWLSDRRSKSSTAYIVSKGISKNRIKGKGYGETKLKVSDVQIDKATTMEEKEELHQLNRRTEFIITKAK